MNNGQQRPTTAKETNRKGIWGQILSVRTHPGGPLIVGLQRESRSLSGIRSLEGKVEVATEGVMSHGAG